MCTPPKPERCEYIGLGLAKAYVYCIPGSPRNCREHGASYWTLRKRKMQEVHVVRTCWVINTLVLSHHFHHLLDTFSCHFRESRHVGHFTRGKPGREQLYERSISSRGQRMHCICIRNLKKLRTNRYMERFDPHVNISG